MTILKALDERIETKGLRITAFTEGISPDDPEFPHSAQVPTPTDLLGWLGELASPEAEVMVTNAVVVHVTGLLDGQRVRLYCRVDALKSELPNLADLVGGAPAPLDRKVLRKVLKEQTVSVAKHGNGD